MSRQFNLYAFERRAGHLAYVLPLWVVQQSVAAYYLGLDVRRTVARVTRNSTRLGRRA